LTNDGQKKKRPRPSKKANLKPDRRTDGGAGVLPDRYKKIAGEREKGTDNPLLVGWRKLKKNGKEYEGPSRKEKGMRKRPDVPRAHHLFIWQRRHERGDDGQPDGSRVGNECARVKVVSFGLLVEGTRSAWSTWGGVRGKKMNRRKRD